MIFLKDKTYRKKEEEKKKDKYKEQQTKRGSQFNWKKTKLER